MYRKPDDVETRVLDWGTIKWLVTPDLDEGAGLTTGEVIVYPEPRPCPAPPSGERCSTSFREKASRPLGRAQTVSPSARATLSISRRTCSIRRTTQLGSPLRLIVVCTPGGAERVLGSLPGTRVLRPGEAPVWAQVV